MTRAGSMTGVQYESWASASVRSPAYAERTAKLPSQWARSESGAAPESPWRCSSGSGVIPM